MKNNKSLRNEESDEKANNAAKSIRTKKRNMKRLGGGGLSLETFANAKSTKGQYNPGLIKKQREFYNNAKKVNKYKKTLKQEAHHNDISTGSRPHEEQNETGVGSSSKVYDKKEKEHKKRKSTLEELYRKSHEEEEKIKREREAIMLAKKEAKEKSVAQRKASKEKFLKRTRYGQPVMKYRIEHLLETIQKSVGNSDNRNA